MNVRAKMRCTSESAVRYGPGAAVTRKYEFNAVYEPDVPEDQRYAKATPMANLIIAVDNPAVGFEPGAAYYLDFTKVEN